MEGICGNLDGDLNNDWAKPDGTLVKVGDYNALGESWLVPNHPDSAM